MSAGNIEELLVEMIWSEVHKILVILQSPAATNREEGELEIKTGSQTVQRLTPSCRREGPPPHCPEYSSFTILLCPHALALPQSLSTVHPSAHTHSLDDWLALLRETPEELFYGPLCGTSNEGVSVHTSSRRTSRRTTSNKCWATSGDSRRTPDMEPCRIKF